MITSVQKENVSLMLPASAASASASASAHTELCILVEAINMCRVEIRTNQDHVITGEKLTSHAIWTHREASWHEGWALTLSYM